MNSNLRSKLTSLFLKTCVLMGTGLVAMGVLRGGSWLIGRGGAVPRGIEFLFSMMNAVAASTWWSDGRLIRGGARPAPALQWADRWRLAALIGASEVALLVVLFALRAIGALRVLGLYLIALFAGMALAEHWARTMRARCRIETRASGERR